MALQLYPVYKINIQNIKTQKSWKYKDEKLIQGKCYWKEIINNVINLATLSQEKWKKSAQLDCFLTSPHSILY